MSPTRSDPPPVPPASLPRGLAEGTVYRSMFTASPDGLLLVDTVGTIVLANPAAAELLGYSLDELVGLPVDALVPDGIRPRHAAFRAEYARNPRPRPMGMQMELVARRRDGTEVRVEIALSPLQSQGLPYVLAAVRDVGEYPRVKQALQRARYSESLAQLSRLAVDTRDVRQLLDRVPAIVVETLEADDMAVWLLDADRRELQLASAAGIASVYKVGTRLGAGPDTAEGYCATHSTALIVADHALESRFQVPQAVLDAGLTSALAVPLSDRGRTLGVLLARSRQRGRFRDDERHFLQSLANLLVSSLLRAQSEEALMHAQRMESVGQLTGGIAHDFNNLLTVIHGNLQVLEELPTVAEDAYAQQLVGAATRASLRGADLTGKLLVFSRRQVLQPRHVDVGQLLTSLNDMLRRTLDRRIEILVDTPPCPGVLADPGQLESALLNIAINARDAMPDGGRLCFRCRPWDTLPPDAVGAADVPRPATRYVAIAVSDTGVGMPEAVRSRVFEPFFTTKEAGRGTGLGLSTVYGFVTQSRGAITLDSAPGAGTTVTLYIPQAETALQGEVRTCAVGETPPANLSVLLVEDDTEVREVMRSLMHSFGCRVVACASGEEALALEPPAGGFDLLLSDVALGPGMRGTELARLASTRWPGLAVLLMSGYSTELFEPQAWPLLHKPCSREQLGQAMARVMARR